MLHYDYSWMNIDEVKNEKERIEKILKIHKEMETTIHSIEREMNQIVEVMDALNLIGKE